jgi:hypothetical protein
VVPEKLDTVDAVAAALPDEPLVWVVAGVHRDKGASFSEYSLHPLSALVLTCDSI